MFYDSILCEKDIYVVVYVYIVILSFKQIITWQNPLLFAFSKFPITVNVSW